jgi:hypothetical protein
MLSSIIGTRALINLFYGGRKVRALSIGGVGKTKVAQQGAAQ